MSLLPVALLAFGLAQAATPLQQLDFEADDGACTSEGETAQWEWGTITGGPGSAWDGSRGWALSLDGGYLNDTTDTLTCGPVDVTGSARPVLLFAQWYDFDSGDQGTVEIDDGSGWQAVTPIYATSPEFTGSSGGWVQRAVDLTGRTGPISARWVASADLSGVGGGWFLDGVGWWDGDPVAPEISDVTVLGDTDFVNEPRLVNARVVDDVGLMSVALRCTVGSADPVDVAMSQAGDVWSAEVPGEPPDTTVTYAVVARDAENEASSSTVSFRYFLEAPENLHLADPRAVGHTLALEWEPPFTGHIVQGYRVYRDDALVARVDGTTAEVPVTGAPDTFVVTAVYGEGEGDPSAALIVTASVPVVSALSPAEGWPGDHLHLDLTGEYLLLTDGQVTASLGEGVSVGVGVRNVDSAVLDVEIADDATPGPRDLVLETPTGETTASGAFTVLDGDDRPRLLPDDIVVRQGEAATLSLAYVGEMATTTPVVALGQDIVVKSVLASDGTVTVECAVSGSAAIGDRTVTIDDGVRIFDGVTLTVANSSTQGTGGCQCGTGGGPGGLAGGLLLAVAVVRRRAGVHARICLGGTPPLPACGERVARSAG